MIENKTIDYFENKTTTYTVVIGVDGYNSIADNYSYFDDYYLPKYVEKITLISMLLMSWYSVKLLFMQMMKNLNYTSIVIKSLLQRM